MRHRTYGLYLSVAVICYGPCVWAQQAQQNGSASVPKLVQFSGTVNDASARPVAGVTFSLYKDQEGGAPMWQETQNVSLDESGRYSVMLGATTNSGLPAELFTSGQARWLGVQPESQAEQPRVLLLSVPYALKAADAETIGGLRPSAFMLAPLAVSGGTAETSAATPATGAVTPALTGNGTLDFVPLWTPNGNTLGNSIIFQSSSSEIGIGTQTPGAKLDVAGSGKVRGTLLLPAAGSATASGGKNSQPLNLAASAFSSSVSTAVSETFSLRAEPAGNDTPTPSATLNLLFGSGTSSPTETGLNISSTGLVTFAPGQTFPGTGTISGVTASSGLTGGGTSGNVTLGLLTSCAANQVLQWNGSTWVCASVGTGNGTITGVTAGTDLTGGGTNGTVTLNLDTNKVPQLSTNNTYTGIQSFNAPIAGQTGTFLGNTSGVVFTASNSNGTGIAILAQSTGFGGVGLEGSGSIGVLGNATGQGPGVAASGSSLGLRAEATSSNNTTTAVLGQTTSLSGTTFGVNGSSLSATGMGVLGQGSGYSKTGTGIIGCCPVGVWGDMSSNAGGAAGLVGTADDARAIFLQNNSPSGVPTAYMFQGASGKLALLAGGAVGACTVDTSGNLVCHGSISAVVPVDGGARQVALYAVEAPQNWFEDFGSGNLANGAASVALEPTFAQTVNAATDYHVFLTPEGDCRGLYVSNKTAAGFEVHELSGGQSNVAFAYRIVALRRGYEDVRLADKSELMAQWKAGIPKVTATPARR